MHHEAVCNEVSLSVGVPQGSTLGPLLMTVQILALKTMIALFAQKGFVDDDHPY